MSMEASSKASEVQNNLQEVQKCYTDTLDQVKVAENANRKSEFELQNLQVYCVCKMLTCTCSPCDFVDVFENAASWWLLMLLSFHPHVKTNMNEYSITTRDISQQLKELKVT